MSIHRVSWDNPLVSWSSDTYIREKIYLRTTSMKSYTILIFDFFIHSISYSFFDLDFFSCTSTSNEKTRDISDASSLPI